MKWILVLTVLMVGAFARAETPDQELIRLRKENAALKAEIVKLKEELAAAKPAPPKATRYTPEMIVKLIPKDVMPVDGKWDDARRSKAKKILEANLVDERAQIAVPLEPRGEDAHTWMRSKTIPSGSFNVVFECKAGDQTKPVDRAAGATGKIVRLNLTQADAYPALITVVLEDCQLSK